MKEISFEEFKNIIFESVAEGLGGSAPAGLGGSAPAGLGGSAPVGLGGAKKPAQKQNSNGFSPNLEYAYYEQPQNEPEHLVVGIGYVYDSHHSILMNEWAKKYSQIFLTRRVMNDGDKTDKGSNVPAILELHVNPGKEQEFEQIVHDIVQSMADKIGKTLKMGVRSGQYDLANLQKLSGYIINSVANAPNKADLDKAKERTIDTWMDLLSRMEDPATMKKISKIGGTVYNMQSPSIKASNAGHQISLGNRAEVYAQLPNATFVTQEWTWNNVFNRDVVDKSQFAIIFKPKTKKPSDLVAFNKAAQLCGYADYDDFRKKKRAKRLSQQQIFAVMAQYNMLNPNTTDFIAINAYDVANTQLRQGEPDVFANEIGFEDNIQGVPNSAARAADAQLAADAGKPYNPGQIVTKTEDEVYEIKTIIFALCSQAGVSVNSVGDVGDDIVHACYKYAELILAPKFGKIKPEYGQAFCHGVASAIAVTYGLKSEKGAKFLNAALANRKQETALRTVVAEFFMDYKKMILTINRELTKSHNKMRKSGQKVSAPVKSVAEDASEATGQAENPPQPMSFEEFSEILGVNPNASAGEPAADDSYEEADTVPTQQQVMESFYNLLDKMEIL